MKNLQPQPRLGDDVVLDFVGPGIDRYLSEMKIGGRAPIGVFRADGWFVPTMAERRQYIRHAVITNGLEL